MHVNAKTVAFGGLMLALTEVCIALGSVIETNTLFLLAAASYCVGIVIRETGLKSGISFWVAGVFLGILIAPNKFYVFSYAAMGVYILIIEAVWNQVGRLSENKNRMAIFCGVKFIVFHVISLLILYAGKEIIFTGTVSWQLMTGIVAAGEFGFWVYDKAYEYVQREIWTKIRGRLI